MARTSSEAAIAKIGSKFDLVLVASCRARELSNGSAPKVQGKDASFTVTALREIEMGLYTKNDYMKSLPKRKKGNRHEHFA